MIKIAVKEHVVERFIRLSQGASTLLLKMPFHSSKKEAQHHGINIVEAERLVGYHEELDWLSFPLENLQIDVVVGHGVKLGRQAQVIRKSHRCKWVQVVHTDPEKLGMYKGYENPISKGEQKHSAEVELCQMSDLVVAVGPKLAEAFRKYLRWCKKDQNVFEFNPGVFADFSSVEQALDERKEHSVLIFGRGDDEDFKLKGFDLAARSVTALPDTHLVFVGAPEGKHSDVTKHFLDSGISERRLTVRGFKDREALKREFCEADLVLMPSRTEGFGLTALEAMSAGLPVIVSKNSGFGEALGRVPFGSSFVIDSEDPSVWTAAIKGTWNKDRRTRLDEIKILRDAYGKRYSWSEQCKNLLDKMASLLVNRQDAFGRSQISSQEVVERRGTSIEDRAGSSHQDDFQGGMKRKRKRYSDQDKAASDVKEGKADKKAIDGEEKQYGGNEGKDDGGDAEAGKTEMQEQEHYDQGRYDDDLSAQISETTEEDLFHGIHELPMKEQEELEKVAIFEGTVTSEGFHLALGAIHLTFPPDTVAEPTDIMVNRWKYGACLPQLTEHEAVVSNVVEICAPTEVGSLKFNNEVKLVLSHSAADLEGYELVMKRLTDTEKNEWEEIAGCENIRQVSDIEDDNPWTMNAPYSFPVVRAGISRCSTYAVVSRLKLSPTYTITVSGGTFAHPDYPQVIITVPKKAVATETKLSLQLKVGYPINTVSIIMVVNVCHERR
ncbi:PREDICTED: uncharacterized protein LOC107330190 [Acropora digitifera]|uniref:uncharacterized protein LOC107330190 n=1 Tax=Acropora digitifera TaxID=70779 RepID=UPI00077AD018|nr:PREDICTED: uncharacterized protein LOC107330190 [Acropora digitifera]